MKKHIKGMVAYGVLIIAVLVYVLMRVGITFNLTKVMPEFATQIYSKANMLYYDINTIKSAKNQINKQIDKIRNDVYQDKDYFEKGLREILDLNEKNLSEYLASFSEIKKDKYNNLKKVDNIDYITSKGNNYQDNTRQNSLSLYIYPMTAIDNDLYYEMDADFYKPLTVKKDDISKLKVGDKYNFNYPIGTSSEVIELTYEADKKLKYDYEANVLTEEEKIETKTLTQEMTLKEVTALPITKGGNIKAYRETPLYTPTYEDFIALCKEKGLHPFIEIKTDPKDYPQAPYKDIITVLERYGMCDKATIISFSYEALQTIRGYNADIPLQLLTKEIDAEVFKKVEKLGACGIDCAYESLLKNQELVSLAKHAFIPLNAWTVDSPQAAEQLWALGVEYITTNAAKF